MYTHEWKSQRKLIVLKSDLNVQDDADRILAPNVTIVIIPDVLVTHLITKLY